MKLEFNFSKIIEIKNPFMGQGYERLKRTLLGTLMAQKDKLFEQSRDPDGNAWQKLSSGAASRKTKKNRLTDAQISKLKEKNKNFETHKILVDTGALKNSLAENRAPGSQQSTTGNEVVLGTNIPYASIQNYGGQVQIPLIKNGFGLGIEIPAHTVTIPARPFIGFGADDDKEVTETIEGYLKRASS